MKKFVFTAIAVVAVMALTPGLFAQPGAGGAGGAPGGGMGGFGGMDFGGMGGPGGGMMGGMGMMMMMPRPEKAARVASVKELEKQIAALKEAVNKAPDKDPNLVTIKDPDLTKFMDTFTVESDAINKIQATLTAMTRVPGEAPGGMGGMMGMMGMMGRGGPTSEVLTELKGLAQTDKATKTSARIDALIKEAQQREEMMQNMGGMGGGMMGGGMGGGMMGGGMGGPGAGGPGAGGAGAGGGARRGAQ
ncbi:MAG: hypothetical protein JW787_02105 [Sedimentisphaerales bacterium]|nr:hypothetical protein [Sedimentisphaerales bacterium]